MMGPRDYLNSERGVATLIALLMMGMLLLIGLLALSSTEDEIQIAGNEMQEMRAFYAAEAGLEMAVAALQTEYDQTGAPPTNMVEGDISMNESTVKYAAKSDGAAEQRVLSTGSLAGLHALVKSFTVSSAAKDNIDGAGMVLSQSFETALVPIFQFAVFYENDLWATPYYDMDIDGRVHVNGDMYLQAFQTLSFSSRVTASGGVHQGFPSASISGANGDIQFTDAGGNLVSMKDGSGWLENSDSHWRDSSAGRWQGMVLDDAFGQSELNLPLSSSGDSHKMIERGSGNSDSYEHKAGFKIIDGVPYANNSGSWVDVSGSLPAGTVTSVKFYDSREKQEVNTTQVDMGLLRTSGYLPANGVIYSSDQRSGAYNGLRLVNGEEIGKPLSLFSENPVYVQGDFNTTDKQPVAVAGDAVTFLSNNWTDADSYRSLSYRRPDATDVNLALITGDDAPTSSNYGGGLENLPRFLEDWKGTKFTMTGSQINLWRTQQAGGNWSYGSYYTAPTRDWSFDTDFDDPNKLPPETPMVRIFQRKGWRQEYVNFQTDSTVVADTSLLTP